MRLLDLTLPTPEENLALDELLLESAESGGDPETLRFWEPEQFFVVLGYGKKAAEEVFLEQCAADGVPVYRRPSGGGTVLQGPGCLNYALILDVQSRPELRSLTEANAVIMSRLARALSALVPGITPRGVTDLALGEQKFMGNAQRRRRRFLLFHGCILIDPRPELFEKYLRLPSERPSYRRDRAHRDFITRFPASARQVRAALRADWLNPDAAAAPDLAVSQAALRALVREKYACRDWNLKY